MKLSEDRISHLSHLILDHLLERGYLFLAEEREPTIRSRIKRVFHEELEKEETLDLKVRKKIASYKRKIPEGSNEWYLLYRRFYDEERNRSGPDRSS